MRVPRKRNIATLARDAQVRTAAVCEEFDASIHLVEIIQSFETLPGATANNVNDFAMLRLR